MNFKMFKKIMNQANIVIDFSQTNSIKPNSIKIFKLNDIYYAYKIDDKLNKTLIVENDKENNIYKGVLKHLDIKLNKSGNVILNNVSKKI